MIIYPNPADDKLNFNIKEYNDITITDISGKTIMNLNSLSPQNNSVDISILSKGIYFVTIKSDKQLITRKLIKN
jgi:hypothetical protein